MSTFRTKVWGILLLSTLAAACTGRFSIIRPSQNNAAVEQPTGNDDAYWREKLKSFSLVSFADNKVEILPGGNFEISVNVAEVKDNVTATFYYKSTASTGCDSSLTGWTEFASVVGQGNLNTTFKTTGLTPANYYICLKVAYGDIVHYVASATPVIVNANQLLTKGYNERACGYDMNRDGVVGFREDCHVCDGKTTDPDADGLDEDIYYVDSTSGSNNATCGTPSAPCSTVTYAVNTRANGPSVGQEDIICIFGIFDEQVTMAQSGKNETYTRDGFPYPKNPLLISGWDRDADGMYPPFDTDDIAVMNSANTKTRPFNPAAQNHLEFAHMTVQSFTYDVIATTNAADQANFYIHDLKVRDIAPGANAGYVVSIGDNNGGFDNLAVENLNVDDVGVGLVMGTATNMPITNVRVRHNSFKVRSPANDPTYSALNFESVRELLVENNVFDGNYSAWTPAQSIAVNIGNCMLNTVVRNNIAYEWVQLINAFLDATGCVPAGPMDNLVVQNNYMTHVGSAGSPIGIGFRGGGANNATVSFKDIHFLSNYFIKSALSTGSACINSNIGNGGGVNPGFVEIIGNTCVGFGVRVFNAEAFPQQNYIVKNNIFAEISGADFNMYFGQAPTGPVFDGNVYSPTGQYRWNNVTLGGGFTAWKAAHAQDTNSYECAPTFAAASQLNYHLGPDDTCAKNRGLDVTAYYSADSDGDKTAPTGADIGADQL